MWYVYRKSRGGYRDGEESKSEAQSLRVSYQASPKWLIQFDWSRSMYRHKMAGQLTDAQFEENPQQATRNRNYFSPDIQVPSFQVNLTLSERTQLQWQSSAVLGRRSSVMFDKPANVKDTINLTTNAYNNRQVDIDRFHSFSQELRLLHQYSWWGRAQVLSAGVQYMHNRLHRTQLGNGTTGSDYDLTLVTPGFGRDMEFTTRNLAFFCRKQMAADTTPEHQYWHTSGTGTNGFDGETGLLSGRPVSCQHPSSISFVRRTIFVHRSSQRRIVWRMVAGIPARIV